MQFSPYLLSLMPFQNLSCCLISASACLGCRPSITTYQACKRLERTLSGTKSNTTMISFRPVDPVCCDLRSVPPYLSLSHTIKLTFHLEAQIPQTARQKNRN